MKARLKLLLVVTALLLPSVAWADDLGDALSYIGDAIGDEHLVGLEDHVERDEHSALPMIMSRDVEPDAPLDTYADCSNSMIDGEAVMRTSGELQWGLRQCVASMWARDALPGYRTLGSVRLSERDVADWIAIASRETGVPEVLINNIIRFESGFRPGVVSDSGRFGLMQLSPAQLQAHGLSAENLLDPRTNIMTGARYLRALTVRFTDLKLALAAFIDEPALVAEIRDIPKNRKAVWFTREMMRLYYASIREFPNEFGVDNMKFVMTWMD